MTHVTIARPDGHLNAVSSLEGVVEFLHCLDGGMSAEKFNDHCMIAGGTFFYARSEDIDLLGRACETFSFFQQRKQIDRSHLVRLVLIKSSGIVDTSESAILHGLLLPEPALVASIEVVQYYPGRSLRDAVHELMTLAGEARQNCPICRERRGH